MTEIADIMLLGGTLGACIYCMILSNRLRRFADLEKGVGGAVAVLSAQVDDLTVTLSQAQGSAGASVTALTRASERAESAGKQIELLLASLHDLPEGREAQLPITPFFVRHPEAMGRRA